MGANIISVRYPRIVLESDGPAWFVIFGSYAWLFGSRRDALLAARELAREVMQ